MLVDQFYDEIRISRSEGTAAQYRFHVKRFLDYLDKNGLKLAEFSQDDFQKMVVGLVDQNLSAAYIRLVAISIIVYMRWLRDRKEPVQEIKRPKLPRLIKKNPLSIPASVLPEYARIAREAKEPYSTALLLLPMSGFRSQELVTLRLADLKWQAPWMLVTVMGKGRKERTVPLMQQANPILKTYLTGWRASVTKSEWLFPSADGGHISLRTLRRYVQRCGQKIGMSLSPHTMRRTYLTYLRGKGIKGERLARLAGHEDPNFTEEKYVTKNIGDLCAELDGVEFPI
jgi:site-specific recombinase XerD